MQWLRIHPHICLFLLGGLVAVVEGLSATANHQVKVEARRSLPTIHSPEEARLAWLEFVWKKGGGLPLWVREKKSSRLASAHLPTTIQRRQLVPLFMEEELWDDVNDDRCQIRYRVTHGGLLATEIVPDSHGAIVNFEASSPGGTGIQMTWHVTFETVSNSRRVLWQAVTERTIADSCNNFQAAMAKPKLYSRQTRIRLPKTRNDYDDKAGLLKQVMDQWIQFCWKEGAGFPLPIPPLCDDDTRWIIPPFLKERLLSAKVVSSNDDDGEPFAEIQYQVENPGLFTYQVFSHLGRVRFSWEEPETDDPTTAIPVVVMSWHVEVRPYRGWEDAIQVFTGAVVSCYARNFKCHMQEGDHAMVTLKPPRGGGETIVKFRKDSWIGGVLDAHLRDQRSAVEQTIALLQPWTWGRTATGEEEREGEAWNEGYGSRT